MRPARTTPGVPFVGSHCAEARTHALAVIVARPSVASFSKLDQDQTLASAALQFIIADRPPSDASLQRDFTAAPFDLILINAADDSRRIFRKRVQFMSMEDSDAHTRHHSAATPKKDSSHVVGADIRLHLRRLRPLAAMRFATPRRLYPQSCPDRSRRTDQTFAPACLLNGCWSSRAEVALM
jgi:hypothetical protein